MHGEKLKDERRASRAVPGSARGEPVVPGVSGTGAGAGQARGCPRTDVLPPQRHSREGERLRQRFSMMRSGQVSNRLPIRPDDAGRCSRR